MKLRELRPDLPSGGTWSWIGFHPTNYNLVSTSINPSPNIIITDGSTDNPSIYTVNAQGGFYGFRYSFTDSCSVVRTTNVYIQVLENYVPKTVCDYWLNYSPRDYNSQIELDGLRISSFKVNGSEVLTEPLYLGTYSNYMLTGIVCQASPSHNYITNFVDALNSLNVPNYQFKYSNRTESNPAFTCSGYKFHTVSRPTADTFEIIFQQNKGVWTNTDRWTETSVYLWGDSASWEIQNVSGTTGFIRTGGNVKVCL